MYSANQICEMVEVLIDNIFITFGGQSFRQVIRILMGTIFLYFYKSDFFGRHDKMQPEETWQVI